MSLWSVKLFRDVGWLGFSERYGTIWNDRVPNESLNPSFCGEDCEVQSNSTTYRCLIWNLSIVERVLILAEKSPPGIFQPIVAEPSAWWLELLGNFLRIARDFNNTLTTTFASFKP